MKGHEKLIVWQKSMDLVVEIYRITKLLPSSETYGLMSQMCRTAVSIPSNIAEGYARDSTKEYIHFLYIAQGSRAELDTQLKICQRTGLITNDELAKSIALSDEIGKLLAVIIRKLLLKKQAP